MKSERNQTTLSRRELMEQFDKSLSIEEKKHTKAKAHWKRYEAKIDEILEQLKLLTPDYEVQLHDQEHRDKKNNK